MGARGRGAVLSSRSPHKNRRPNAKARAAAVAGGDVTEYSPGYWDLVIGEREGHARPWPTDRDPARRRAWREWRERIRSRWPHGWSHGRRPSGWWSFELPVLLAAADVTDDELAAMTAVELVYRVDADEAERADIEAGWTRSIELARHHAIDAAASRRRAIESWDCPGWFFDERAASPG